MKNLFLNIEGLTEEQKLRLFIRELKKRPKSFIYYNGGDGRDSAIVLKNYSKSYLQAQKNLADDEGVTLEKVQKDYDNWYYVESVSEAIESYQDRLKYILK